MIAHYLLIIFIILFFYKKSVLHFCTLSTCLHLFLIYVVHHSPLFPERRKEMICPWVNYFENKQIHKRKTFNETPEVVPEIENSHKSCVTSKGSQLSIP